ncbi:hypothetical protein TNCT_244611 [Trichonephila clavata]|uniref:Uncharacterized protein n=1 Tax=Trichonephila clavata TaxID=2740835 RepID=A0A8X6KR00_TRICU|nr:hypothetical protein TNCT_244611 [Trichonephila clavata]
MECCEELLDNAEKCWLRKNEMEDFEKVNRRNGAPYEKIRREVAGSFVRNDGSCGVDPINPNFDGSFATGEGYTGLAFEFKAGWTALIKINRL